MRKTLLVTMDFPPLLGGIANYYFNRVNKMPPDKVVVLKHTNNDANIGEYHANDFKIINKNFFIKYIWPHWLPLIWYVYKIAKKENIEMFWVGQVLPVGPTVYIVSKLLHLPYYVSCHGNDLLRAKSVPRKFKLAKKILQTAEYVTANTQFTKNILINDFNLPEDKIKIIYPESTLNPAQVDKKKVEELKEKYNLQGKKVLLTVARLVKSKGIDNVIKVLPEVWKEIPDLVYLIMGNGQDRHRLSQIVNRLPQMHRLKIIFAGAVPHNELPNYYALTDVFILIPQKTPPLTKGGMKGGLSDTESFGIVYLEAKEFGLPIIAGNVGGVREIKNSPPFEGGGLEEVNKMVLVDSEDLERISSAIKKALLK